MKQMLIGIAILNVVLIRGLIENTSLNMVAVIIAAVLIAIGSIQKD